MVRSFTDEPVDAAVVVVPVWGGGTACVGGAVAGESSSTLQSAVAGTISGNS